MERELLSKSCGEQIHDVVKLLRSISKRSASDFDPVVEAATCPLELWAAEVRYLREQKARLPKIAAGLMDNLGYTADSFLGKAVQMAADYEQKQNDEPDYHNKFHVGEVLIGSYLLGLREGLTQEQIAELLLAAVSHDFCHSGTSNTFDFQLEMVSVETAIPIFEEAGLDPFTMKKVCHMILATDFKMGVPPTREAYLNSRAQPADSVERVVFTQALLLTEADVLFSCFDLSYNTLLSKLLATEWKTPGDNLPLKARLGFLNYVKFISTAAVDLGLEKRRLKLIDQLKAMEMETAPVTA